MRKVFIIFFLSLCGIANAQFTKLLDFNGTNGASVRASLAISNNDSILYGCSSAGGINNAGLVFSIKTDGTNFQNLHSFATLSPDGWNPAGSLVQDGNLFYGRTESGGIYNMGTIFSLHPNGTGFSVIYDSLPLMGNEETLTVSGNTIYETSWDGGISLDGSIFSVHKNGTGFSIMHEFSNTSGGYRPTMLAMLLTGGKLYGTTIYSSGMNETGTIFCIDTNGNNFTNLHTFNASEGDGPWGTLALSGNVLYGITSGGGNYGNGTLYSIHTNGSGFTKLFDFNTTYGEQPIGNLIVKNNIIYGSTTSGGTHNYGTLFSINTDGSGFNVLYNFDSPDGWEAYLTLSHSGRTLYGVTYMGGAYSDGTIFKFDLLPPPVPICMVTVDDSSNYNHVVWEKPLTTAIDSFIVYREITANDYKRIGAVPYAALSEFVDTVRNLYFPFTGNPNSGTYRYKLQVRDSSGIYSQLSPYHNTLFVTQSNGNFSWNPYTVEGDTVPLPGLSAYVLYRDDNNSGAWHAVQGVSGTQTTVTDPDYISFPYARWRVETVWGITCTPSKTSYSTSRSNIKTSVSGIETRVDDMGINIYPNPAKGDFTVTTKGINVYSLEIYNVLGKKVYSSVLNETSTQINPQLDGGIYFVCLVKDSKIVGRDKLIISQ